MTPIEKINRAYGEIVIPQHTFSPRIILFTCNHNPYGALLLLGINRMKYPSGYIPLRLACAGDVSPGLFLKAFLKGADGVLVLGCPREQCAHRVGNLLMENTVTVTRTLLGTLGMQPDRLSMKLLPAGDYVALHEYLLDFYRDMVQQGPSPLRKGDSLVTIT